MPKWAETGLTWMCRTAVGGVFLFSGFVKAIDPWGSLYKLEDYAAAMGIDTWPNLLLTGAFLLCCCEFMLGAFLLTGSFRRTSAVCSTLIMAVMLPLTLWIAIANPVADCGCFGDALKIGNWTTFWKNVVLMVMSLWLLFKNRTARCLIDPYLQWLSFTAIGVFIAFIAFAGYRYQPLIDFRDYKVGQPIGYSLDSLDDDAADADNAPWVFRYEKDGVTKDFGEDDVLPDEADGWKFVDRFQRPASDSASTAESATDKKISTDTHPLNAPNFMVWQDGDSAPLPVVDLDGSEHKVLLLMPSLQQVSVAETWRINSLHDWAESHGIYLAAIVSGSDADIAEWKDVSMARYPIYTADDTAIKSLVRGNPAVVYLHNDTIRWKSTLQSLRVEDFMSPDTSADPMAFARDNTTLLRNVSLIYVSVMAALIFLSFTPHLGRMLMIKKTTKR